MKLKKRIAVKTSTGEIFHESYSVTDTIQFYLRVNPSATLVKKVGNKWIPVDKTK